MCLCLACLCLAGSIRDKETAEWTRDKLKSFGITDVYLDTYEVLINEPATGDDISTLAILTPASMAYTAKLTEVLAFQHPPQNCGITHANTHPHRQSSMQTQCQTGHTQQRFTVILHLARSLPALCMPTMGASRTLPS